ncbi:MAG: hypothetical protein OEX04_00425 [Acidimicrobiia bacterium]|nr:hypothetical protein [Acidimicrobiia bacterium]MDH4305920.1 hypothetical protein [Acidimicrobiia bacterium]MDH5295391.1 hypothetical protein [Acidimicrobiia bacterium]
MDAARPRLLRRLFAGVTVEEVQRFDAALDATLRELERRRHAGGSDHLDSVESRVESASRARADFQLQISWTALKSAEREMIRSFTWPELTAEAHVIRGEADEKLSGWRHASVVALLPDAAMGRSAAPNVTQTIELSLPTESADPPNGGAENEAVSSIEASSATLGDADGQVSADQIEDLKTRLIRAKAMVDVHTDNMYHKYRILRRAVIITSVSLAVVLASLAAGVASKWVPAALAPADSPLLDWQSLLMVMGLGALGAYLSSATRLSDREEKLTIPDIQVTYTLMGMRPFVGATGAVVAIVMLQSVLADAIKVAPNAMLGIAVAAGFTERLVTKTITSAADAVSR